MKKLYSLALAAMLTLGANAAPAYPGLKTYTQPDGTTISVRLVGDETYAYFVTEDNVPLVRDAKGTFFVAKLEGGQLTATSLVAHNAQQRTAAEQAFVAANAAQVLTSAENNFVIRHNARQAQRAARRKAPAQNTFNPLNTGGVVPGTFDGSLKGLVVLIEFQDQKFVTPNANAVYQDMMNGESFDSGRGKNYGSLRKYFAEQSYGKLDLEFDVVGPVTLPNNLEYYGEDAGQITDYNSPDLLSHTVQVIKDQVDFGKYDWDNDGECDQVVLIYAGAGQNTGAPKNTIWPHEWSLSDAYRQPEVVNGIKVDRYACSAELADYGSTQIDGIGVLVHEFGHCLGFPDFYDTANYPQQYGPHVWSVMNQGCYRTLTNVSGDNPTGYMAYERMFAGWLTPKVLDEPTDIDDMKALVVAPEAYIIYNDRNKDEYYLLENRQKYYSDRACPGHGLLVTHVDYDRTAWLTNNVNTENGHPRLQIIAADNTYERTNYNSWAGDTYPGTSGNTSLTDYSTPAATLYNAALDGRKFMGKAIEGITETEDGLISFVFMGGTPAKTPESVEINNISDNGFDITWGAVAKAETYDIELRDGAEVLAEDHVCLVENVAEVCLGDGRGADAASRVENSIKDFFGAEGWTCGYMFSGVKRMRFGSAAKPGWILSPALDFETGQATIYLNTEKYNDKTAEAEVRLVGADDTVLATKRVTLGGGEVAASFTGVPKGARIGVYAEGRAYFTTLTIYDHALELADIVSPGEAITSALHVPDTHYNFGGLNKGVYQVRVRTNTAHRTSPWTRSARVALGVVDGITATTLDNAPAAVFTLDGRRVKGTPARGIFVSGGKKIVK